MELPTIVFHGAKLSVKEGYKIKKIDVATVESLNRELQSIGTDIKELQDRLESVITNIMKEKADFEAGKLERLTAHDIQEKFHNEKMEIMDSLRNANRKSLEIMTKMKSLMDEHRLE